MYNSAPSLLAIIFFKTLIYPNQQAKKQGEYGHSIKRHFPSKAKENR